MSLFSVLCSWELNSEFRICFQFIFLRDGLHFCVNVKVFLLLFVRREMAHYFYMIEFCKGV